MAQTSYLTGIFVGLIPVFLFLGGLIFFDSYKLVTVRSILIAIGIGCLAAVAAFALNMFILSESGVDTVLYGRYGAPLIEECLKAAYLVILLRKKRIGFLVDAAIYGFALGAGFAFIENVYYMLALEETNITLWIVRGVGTAIMHGGTTALIGIIGQNMLERRRATLRMALLPGIALAAVIHSAFNHFFFPPMISTLLILIVVPAIIALVFIRSEKATREWLGAGFDLDVEMMEILESDTFPESKLGTYLGTMKEHFPGEIVADMLCLIRIHTELSIKAKAMILMKQAGFPIEADGNVRSALTELGYLEKAIGKTGRLALAPFLHTSSKNLALLQQVAQNT